MIVVSEPRPRVRLVTLDRPARRNALDLAGFRDLAAAWRRWRPPARGSSW
ncbi:hypothetical protein ACFSTC_62905 [Nonomuraea ferruginea]